MRETEIHARLNLVRGLAAPVGLSLSAALLSGCLGSPTYGTGKAADQQLVEDVTGILSLGPKDKERISYNPRPGLVMPASTEVLPPPQEDVATAGNPAWPESPEQRLARIRAEATENQNNPAYRSPVVRDTSTGIASTKTSDRDKNGRPNPAVAKRKREEVLQQQASANQLDSNTRRYLSEPPVEYRAPAATAPAGVLGEDEAAKERAAKQAAQKGGGGWGRLWPWGG